MRVLFLHPDWQIGGVEQTNLHWIEIFLSENIESQIITCFPCNVNGLSDLVCKIFRNKLFLYLIFPFYAWRFDKLIVCQSYYLPWIFLQLTFLRAFCRCDIILTERNSSLQYKEHPFKFSIICFLLNKFGFIFNSVIVNSLEMSQERLFFRVRERVFVVKNPRFSFEDFQKFSPCTERDLSYLRHIRTYARWSDQKNVDFSVSAANVFNEKGLCFEYFCGKNDLYFQRNFVNDAALVMYSEPSIIFFCSRFEGFPNSLLEARCLGLPILFSSCPTGVSEVLNGYDNCFEFKPDNLDSLGDALCKLLDSGPQLAAIDLDYMREHSVISAVIRATLLTAVNGA
jgi:glycosyltransferase involved in cell wall biosynthesis